MWTFPRHRATHVYAVSRRARLAGGAGRAEAAARPGACSFRLANHRSRSRLTPRAGGELAHTVVLGERGARRCAGRARLSTTWAVRGRRAESLLVSGPRAVQWAR